MTSYIPGAPVDLGEFAVNRDWPFVLTPIAAVEALRPELEELLRLRAEMQSRTGLAHSIAITTKMTCPHIRTSGEGTSYCDLAEGM